ncbi:MAG: NUDIX hydrolase [Lachnospirales bacterium]
MIESTSCGGIVFHKGKVLLLYKNQYGKYAGWVMPRGTMEPGESTKETALRELKEEASVVGKIINYVGKTQYTFQGYTDAVRKTIHWYLMVSDSFYCKPQKDEFFTDAGYYKLHEAYHLLKFHDEKQIMRQAYNEYNEYRRNKNNKFNKKKGVLV